MEGLLGADIWVETRMESGSKSCEYLGGATEELGRASAKVLRLELAWLVKGSIVTEEEWVRARDWEREPEASHGALLGHSKALF